MSHKGTSPTIALWHSMTVNRAGAGRTSHVQYLRDRPQDETAIAVLSRPCCFWS